MPLADWRTTHYVRVRHPEGHAIHGAATTTEPVLQISQINNWLAHWVGYATSNKYSNKQKFLVILIKRNIYSVSYIIFFLQIFSLKVVCLVRIFTKS
jgi:hypothetical protein